ncbi:MAG: four helix bundle protein [Cytophagales bacterium]
MRHHFKNLQVWQISMTFIKKVYEASVSLPEIEKFGLIQQMRRSAVSVASNIAEGTGRSTDKDFVNFLHISLGSTYEIETQILLCDQLNYFSKETVEILLKEVSDIQKMLIGLINSIKSKLQTQNSNV